MNKQKITRNCQYIPQVYLKSTKIPQTRQYNAQQVDLKQKQGDRGDMRKVHVPRKTVFSGLAAVTVI